MCRTMRAGVGLMDVLGHRCCRGAMRVAALLFVVSAGACTPEPAATQVAAAGRPESVLVERVATLPARFVVVGWFSREQAPLLNWIEGMPDFAPPCLREVKADLDGYLQASEPGVPGSVMVFQGKRLCPESPRSRLFGLTQGDARPGEPEGEGRGRAARRRALHGEDRGPPGAAPDRRGRTRRAASARRRLTGEVIGRELAFTPG